MSKNNLLAEKLKKVIMVIPSINGLHLLRRFFLTIDIPLTQVVVVDQGSYDGTEAFCLENGAHCLQLGAQATFTRASNVGIKWALEKGAEYVCVANNDIEFLTPVVHLLLETFLKENRVGIVAPQQIQRTREGIEATGVRAVWNLSETRFFHDFAPAKKQHEILEADFCEFTCVLIPAKIILEIGLLDNRYGFYHEDGEFCYRLHLKGYRCLYNQYAQIRHYLNSTIHARKIDPFIYINKNKKLFAAQYLHFGVNFPRIENEDVDSWSISAQYFSKYFRKYGLWDQRRPAFTIDRPGSDALYLWTVWETTSLPKEWLRNRSAHAQIFVPSKWNVQVFKNLGYQNVNYVPLGFDPDYFHAYGKKFDYGVDKAFLIVCRNQYRKALDISVQAWLASNKAMPDAWLFLYGVNIHLNPWLGKPTECHWDQKLKWHRYSKERIVVLEPVSKLSPEEIASLYRGAHAVILNSRSEGFGYTVVEAMACGALTVVPNYGSTAEFISKDNCLVLSGVPIKANYSDKNFSAVGDWWEPSCEDLIRCLHEAYHMSAEEKQSISYAARQFALTHFTWRTSMLAMRKALMSFQDPLQHFSLRAPKIIPQPPKTSPKSTVDSFQTKLEQPALKFDPVKMHNLVVDSKLKASILIPVFNSPKHLRNLLYSLSRNTDPWFVAEVIIGDDASDQATKHIIADFAKVSILTVKVITREKNLGYLKNMNHIFSLATGDIAICLNSDTLLPENWLPRVLKPFALYPDIALASPCSNNAAELTMHPTEGQSWVDMDRIFASFSPKYPHAHLVVGFALAVRRSAINDTPLFDERYSPGYYEENDLEMRMLQLGYRAVVIDNLLIYHAEGSSSFSQLLDVATIRNANHKKFFERWAKEFAESEALRKRENGYYDLHDEDLFFLYREAAYSLEILFVLPAPTAAAPFEHIVLLSDWCNRHGKRVSLFVAGEKDEASSFFYGLCEPWCSLERLKQEVTSIKWIVAVSPDVLSTAQTVCASYGAKLADLVEANGEWRVIETAAAGTVPAYNEGLGYVVHKPQFLLQSLVYKICEEKYNLPVNSATQSLRPVICVTHVSPWASRAGNEYRLQRLLDWLLSRNHPIVLVLAPLPGIKEVMHCHAGFDALVKRYGNVVICQRDGRVWSKFTTVNVSLQGLHDLPITCYQTPETRLPVSPFLYEIEHRFCYDALIGTVCELERCLTPSILYINYIFMTRLLPFIGKTSVSFIDTIDVFSTKRAKVQQYDIPEDLAITAEEEARLLRRADLLIAIQENEARELKAIAPQQNVITLGVDFQFKEHVETIPVVLTMLYVGSFNPMNIKGLKDFLQIAWPKIVASVPEMCFLIVGSIGSVVDIHDRRIALCGSVEDMDVFYQMSSLAINPAIAGTGLKIKTVEALSNYCPIVVWPNGADGLPVNLRKLCTIVESWEDFSAQCIRLLNNPVKEKLSESERALVRQTLSAEQVYADLATWLDQHAGMVPQAAATEVKKSSPRVLVLFVRYGTVDYADALTNLDALYLQYAASVDRTILVIDNALPADFVEQQAHQITIIGGDNTWHEFSGWDRGLQFMGSSLDDYDVVHLVTSAFEMLYNDYLKKFDADLLRLVAAKPIAVGHIDYYPHPIRLGEQVSQHWLRTSFVFIAPRELKKLATLVSAKDYSRVFSGDYTQPFLADGDVSPGYAALITSWLTSQAGTGQGVAWHSCMELKPETLERFQDKTSAILNEHSFSIRVALQACKTVDLTYLLNPIARQQAWQDSIPEWQAQVSQRGKASEVVVMPEPVR